MPASINNTRPLIGIAHRIEFFIQQNFPIKNICVSAVLISAGLVNTQAFAASCQSLSGLTDGDSVVFASNCSSIFSETPGTQHLNLTINTGVIINGDGADSAYWQNERSISSVTNNGTISGTDKPAVFMVNITTILGTFTNNGTIASTNATAFALTFGATIDNLINAGSITSSGTLPGDQGFSVTPAAIHYSTLNINSFDNTSTGIIASTLANSAGFYMAAGTIASFTNAGQISGALNGMNLAEGGRITNFSNTGTVTGVNGINNTNVIVNLNNASTGSITGSNIGIWNSGVHGEITNIINSGLITGTSDSGIYNEGLIGTLTNTGTISGGVHGIWNDGSTITTLNNQQSSLTYNGKLPTNYNIIINSPTDFGRLSASNVVGSTAFGVYAGGVTGVAESNLSNHTYTSVMSGVTTSHVGATRSGVFTGASGGSWLLALEDGSDNIWDLIVNGAHFVSDVTTASLYTGYVQAANNPAAAGAANALGQIETPTGSMGTLANFLAGSSTDKQKSNAISQTLPMVVGAASQATANTQRSLSQIVQARQSQAAGLSSGEEFSGNKDMWMKAFGVWASQQDFGGVSGYKASTGGLAIGGDTSLTSRANIGGVFAFANSNVDGNNAAAPNSMQINSYQAGVYGDLALSPVFNYNYQADFGVNQNQGTRNIIAAAVSANAKYRSYSSHLGSGVKAVLQATDNLTVIPSTRIDYTMVRSNAYNESGADSLNLQNNAQTFQELLVSADLRLDYALSKKLKATLNGGASYNTLGNQVQMTSLYQGGGPAFVTDGLAVAPLMFEAGLGVIGQLRKNLEVIVRYDAQYRTSGYFGQMASARMKLSF